LYAFTGSEFRGSGLPAIVPLCGTQARQAGSLFLTFTSPELEPLNP
jgi:hypothetical protein